MNSPHNNVVRPWGAGRNLNVFAMEQTQQEISERKDKPLTCLEANIKKLANPKTSKSARADDLNFSCRFGRINALKA